MKIIDKIESYISRSRDKIKIKQEFGVVLYYIRTFNDSNILSKASSLAFTTLLSLIPLLAVVFMVFKLFGGREVIDKSVKPILYEFLTPVNGDKLAAYLDSFIESAKVETIGSLGVIFLVITVYSILKTVEDNFNIIWRVNGSRKVMDRIKSFLLVLILSPILITISVTLNGYIEEILRYGDNIWSGFSGFILFYVIPFFLVYLFFLLLNIFIPNTNVHIRDGMVGSLYGTVFYYLSKNIFVHYTSMAVSTNIIYGSLAILPFLMLWLQLFWIIVLSSVKLSFIRQNFSGLAMFVNSKGYGRGDRLRVAFDILRSIHLKHSDGVKRVTTIQDLSKSTNNPIYIISDIVDRLVSGDVLVRTIEPEGGVLLSTSVDKIAIEDIIDLLDNQQQSSLSCGCEKINTLFTKSGNLKHGVEAKSIKDIF